MVATDFRSLSSQAQVDLRRKAVQAVLVGQTREEVASRFGVTGKSVGGWVKKFKQEGSHALLSKRRGRPRGGYFTLRQSREIASSLMEKRPEDFDIPYPLWTRDAVRLLFIVHFDIPFSIWTAGRYLKRWGFTPQRPLQSAFEQNPKSVRRWLSKNYPMLRMRAKREGAEIYWGSTMWLRPNHIIGRLYGLKGYMLGYFVEWYPLSGSMISAVTNRGRLSFMTYEKRFCTEVFVDFLERLARQARRKVYLIVDGHPVHRSRNVKQWLDENPHRIRLFILP